MLVKLAKDDPHVIALWTEGHAYNGEWMIGTSQGAENIRAPQAPQPRALSEQQAGQPLTPSPAQPGFPGPLWGQLSLASCCQPSLVSGTSCGTSLHRLDAKADSSKGPLASSPPRAGELCQVQCLIFLTLRVGELRPEERRELPRFPGWCLQK